MEKIRKIKTRLILGPKIDKDYKKHVADIVKSDIFWSMGSYVQHGDVTCLEHSLIVSYKSYRVCKKLGLDYHSAARGGLLHDFFLYDWHIKGDRKGLHGFHHPRVALKNARTHFDINDIETDIIIKHMWPLTINLPLYRESFIVALIDKYCAMAETIYSGNARYADRLILSLAIKYN